MAVKKSDHLTVFVLNVGQADTSIIKTPEGNVVLIDAYDMDKIQEVFAHIELEEKEPIKALIITHPHEDHYDAASSLIEYYDVKSVYLPPFWHKLGWGPNSYRTLLNAIEKEKIATFFISGYGRLYPDDLVDDTTGEAHSNGPWLELLGPPNSLISNIVDKEKYDRNHLSIITKLNYMDFVMVFAADCQMENWAYFDTEGMLAGPCHVLKAAHHGSKRGTQWERIERLQPNCVVISSLFYGGHGLPDLIGTTIFKEYSELGNDPLVCLTKNTGTVEFVSKGTNVVSKYIYKDTDGLVFDSANRTRMTKSTNPTNWDVLLKHKMNC